MSSGMTDSALSARSDLPSRTITRAVRVGGVVGDAAAHDRRLAGPLGAEQHRVHPLVARVDADRALLVAAAGRPDPFCGRWVSGGAGTRGTDERSICIAFRNGDGRCQRQASSVEETTPRLHEGSGLPTAARSRLAYSARPQNGVALDELVLRARLAAQRPGDGSRDVERVRGDPDLGEEERPVLHLEPALELLPDDLRARPGVAALRLHAGGLQAALLGAEEPAREAVERRRRRSQHVLDRARPAGADHRVAERVDERRVVALDGLQALDERPRFFIRRIAPRPSAAPLSPARGARPR